MFKFMQKIFDKFPSLKESDTQTGWATIVRVRDGTYDLYRGDSTYLGFYKTMAQARAAAAEQGLLNVVS